MSRLTTQYAATERWRQNNSDAFRASRTAAKKAERLAHPEAIEARRKVQTAIKRGEIERPGSCQNCEGIGTPHEHHWHGYENALDVQWLCRRCHTAAHRQARVLAGQVSYLTIHPRA